MGHIKRALQCSRTYLLRVKMVTSSAFIVQPNFLIKRNVFTASKSRTPLRTTGGRGSVVQTQAGFFSILGRSKEHLLGNRWCALTADMCTEVISARCRTRTDARRVASGRTDSNLR